MKNFNQPRKLGDSPQTLDGASSWDNDGWSSTGKSDPAGPWGSWGDEASLPNGDNWSQQKGPNSEVADNPESLSTGQWLDWEDDQWSQEGSIPADWNNEIDNKRGIARKIIDAIKVKFGSPETQEAARQVVTDYGRVALMGALENAGIYEGGRVRKRGVLKAIFMPKRKARQAATGAIREVSGHMRRKGESALTQEAEKRFGEIGGIAVRRLVQFSPI